MDLPAPVSPERILSPSESSTVRLSIRLRYEISRLFSMPYLLPQPLTMALNRSDNLSTPLTDLAMTKRVLSPAMVPSMPGHFIASRRLAGALAAR
jgi:hypothetical protein